MLIDLAAPARSRAPSRPPQRQQALSDPARTGPRRRLGRARHRPAEMMIHAQQARSAPGAELVGRLRFGLVGSQRILSWAGARVMRHPMSRTQIRRLPSTRSAGFRDHRLSATSHAVHACPICPRSSSNAPPPAAARASGATTTTTTCSLTAWWGGAHEGSRETGRRLLAINAGLRLS